MITSIEGDLVIRASAGSGKTFQLTNRLLANLLDGIPPNEIWVATFTRKAAGEILARTVERLVKATTDEGTARKLSEELNRPNLTKSDFVACLRKLLTNLHRLRIGTLDSLFQRIASAFPFELDLIPGWSILEEADATANREEALDSTLTGDDDRVRLLVRLYDRMAPDGARRGVRSELLKIVQELYNAYLAVPEAGWQTQAPVAPAGDIEEVVNRALTIPVENQISKSRIEGIENAREGRWKDFISKGLGKNISAGQSVFNRKPIPTELIDCYREILAFAEFAIANDSANSLATLREFLDEYHPRHEAIRIASGELGFDDVTRALAERLEPARPGFEERLDGRLVHLLLDEFQDTSTSQWRVLEKLVERVRANDGRIFAVGDVKQAIYGWRGGRAELLDRLPELLGGVPTQSMEESRRSATAIIDCVNAVFGKLVDCVEGEAVRAGASLWKTRFEKHDTVHKDRKGYVFVQTGPAEVDGDGAVGRRGRHYRFVAERIRELGAEKPTATIGVLCRKNDAVGRMIYELRKLDVSASEEGGNAITDSAAVEGILSLLTLADHPGDSIAGFHLQTDPFAGWLRAIGYDPADPIRTSKLVRAELIEYGYGSTIARWAKSLKPICPDHDRLRLDQLVEFADAYRAKETLRPIDFVNRARLHKAALPTSNRVSVLTLHKAKGLEFDAVVLPELDVPLSGGKHPPYVVAEPDPPGLPHGFVGPRVSQAMITLASDSARTQTETAARREVEESLCLFYVGLTRPKEALYAYPPGPTLRNRKDYWDTLLLNALCGEGVADAKSRAAETVVFTAGDRKWTSEEVKKTATNSPIARPIRFRESDSRRGGVPPLTPSRSGRTISGEKLFENADTQSRRTGTLQHAWFAAIEWLDDGEPSEQRLREIAAGLTYAGIDLNEQLAQFRAALLRPAIRKLFSKATYPDLESVERERPFAVRVGDRIVSGRFDRIVWRKDRAGQLSAEVIDFKTDRIPVVSMPERVEQYRPQIEGYLRALMAIAGLPADRVRGSFAFTELGRIECLILPSE